MPILIHAELPVSVQQKINYLTGRRHACIDIGLIRLRPHLSGRCTYWRYCERQGIAIGATSVYIGNLFVRKTFSAAKFMNVSLGLYSELSFDQTANRND
jgi:hypothetical protein